MNEQQQGKCGRALATGQPCPDHPVTVVPEPPSRFHASPAEIDAFLRASFAEDVLLNFYRTVGDEVLDEALTHGREYRSRKEQDRGKFSYLTGMADVMNEIWDYRYYPAKLPKLETYTRPFNPPRTIADWGRLQDQQVRQEREMLSEPATAPKPENTPCYRTKAHDPHDWLKGRKAVHCAGNPR